MDYETFLRQYHVRKEMDSIRNELLNQKKDGLIPSVEHLMQFMANLHQFQRRPNPSQLIRIPTRLLCDFSIKGAVFYIVKTSLAQLGAHFSPQWVWNQLSCKTDCQRLIKTNLQVLEYTGIYKPFVLYLSSILPEHRMALVLKAERLGAKVVDQLSSSVTHIVQDVKVVHVKKPRFIAWDGFIQRHQW